MYYLKKVENVKKNKTKKHTENWVSLTKFLDPEFYSLSVTSDLTLCSLNSNQPESGEYRGYYENTFHVLQLLLQIRH